MKRLLLCISFIVCHLSFSSIAAQDTPAFPGAEGVARWTTTGGRGGKVIHVTNLNDSGTGSLRAACTASGARIVVFDVSGVIELNSQLKINNPNITIEGQTAPGDGICLKNYTFNISANNVIVRFIRSRMGDECKTEDDAMNSYTHGTFNNIIIDHCSISWSTDECGSFYGINNFTLQWCILSESLRNSVHDKGKHGYGGIWGGQNAAYHHNLLANHDSRNPRFDHDYVNTMKGPVDFVNNVIYNWGSNSTYGGESCNTEGKYKMYNMMNNYYKPGHATNSGCYSRIVNPTTKCTNCTGESTGLVNLVPGHFYITGNYMEGSQAVTNDNWQGVRPDNNTSAVKESIKSTTRFIPEGYEGQTLLTMHTAERAFSEVLNYAGACYKRDVVDQRIVQETGSGSFTYSGSNGSTGGFIDSQSDVGGWPTYISKNKLTDSDNDGMPDIWETANGLNPNDASDAITKTLDSKGYYTNIEVYCNSLVEDIIKAQNADAEESLNEYYPAVTKVNGIPYYDADITAEGGYEEEDPSEGISGIITWAVPVVDTNATYSSEISNYMQSSSYSLGNNILSTGGGTYNNIRFSKFQAQQIQETSANDDNAVTLSFTTKAGYKFKATKMAFSACKVGTGNGEMVVSWKDNGGKKTIVAATSPNRNNSENGFYSTYSNIDLSAASTATEGTSSLIFNLYKLGVASDGTKKEIGIANVIINGTIIDPTGISTPVTLTTAGDGYTYNQQGQRVDSSYRGIVIKNGKKFLQK